MRFKRLMGILLMTLVFGACQAMSPTLVVMEVTREVPVTVFVTAAVLAEETESAQTPTTPPARTTPTIVPTATPDIFPTPVVGQVFVADQAFEFGRMFWIQPVNQVWILTTDADDKRVWQVFEDLFAEGMQEIDPSIVPPTGLFQPERGFGKLWRERPEIRNALGWALSEELGYNTRYEYHAGGTVNNEGEFVAGSGYHVIEDLDRRIYRFIEGAWTWEVTNSQ